jgi:hypothetical protein
MFVIIIIFITTIRFGFLEYIELHVSVKRIK